MKRVFRRPSPAMVVAIVAVVAALGGSAIAGGVLTKKKVNKIITNRAPGLSVASANVAKNVYFARVEYSNPTPAIVAASPGVTAAGESSMGFPILNFPRDMTSCAITGTAASTGGAQIVRQSSQFSSGPTVTMVVVDTSSGVIRTPFSVVAVCP